jgi:hypothetical protein
MAFISSAGLTALASPRSSAARICGETKIDLAVRGYTPPPALINLAS